MSSNGVSGSCMVVFLASGVGSYQENRLPRRSLTAPPPRGVVASPEPLLSHEFRAPTSASSTGWRICGSVLMETVVPAASLDGGRSETSARLLTR
jgi:hypothetical protein